MMIVCRSYQRTNRIDLLGDHNKINFKKKKKTICKIEASKIDKFHFILNSF